MMQLKNMYKTLSQMVEYITMVIIKRLEILKQVITRYILNSWMR